MSKYFKLIAVFLMVIVMALIAGCGGSGTNAKRLTGISPETVVKTFVNAAKDNRLQEAGLYVSPASTGDARTVVKFLTGQSGLDQIKKSNLFSVKKAAEQGNYAVVIATLQEQDSLKFSVKPIGLEKIDGEWYIVDFDQIYRDVKYKILLQLLESI